MLNLWIDAAVHSGRCHHQCAAWAGWCAGGAKAEKALDSIRNMLSAEAAGPCAAARRA